MGGKEKQPVNKPGHGGQEAHLRETVSRFSEIRFGSSISLRFPPPPRGCNRGTRAVGTESPGRRRGRRRPDRRAEPDGEHGPAAAAVVRGAEKPGRPGRRRPLPSPGARAGVPATHLLSPSWSGKVLVGEVPPSRPLTGKWWGAEGTAGTGERTPVPLHRRSGRPHAATSLPAHGLSPPLNAAPAGWALHQPGGGGGCGAWGESGAGPGIGGWRRWRAGHAQWGGGGGDGPGRRGDCCLSAAGPTRRRRRRRSAGRQRPVQPAAASHARAHLPAAAAHRPGPGRGGCQTPGRDQDSGGGAMVVTSSARGGGGDRAPSRRRDCGLAPAGAAALLAGASCLCYGRSLRGEFVHDDVWAIVNNPDVRPGAPLLWGIFSNDFWGKGMAENTSHKSYRPLCVLTFKWVPHPGLAAAVSTHPLPGWEKLRDPLEGRGGRFFSCCPLPSTPPCSPGCPRPSACWPRPGFSGLPGRLGRRGLRVGIEFLESSLWAGWSLGPGLEGPWSRPRTPHSRGAVAKWDQSAPDDAVAVVVKLPSWAFLGGCWAALQMGSYQPLSSPELPWRGDLGRKGPQAEALSRPAALTVSGASRIFGKSSRFRL